MFGKTDQAIEEIQNYMDEKIDGAIANSLARHIGVYQELMEDERTLMKQTAREIKNDLERYSDIPNQIEQLSRIILDYEKEIQRLKAIVQRKDKQLKRLKNAV